MRPLFSRIRDAVLRHSEDGSALAAILFVGGGSVLPEQQVRTMFNPAQFCAASAELRQRSWDSQAASTATE